MTEREFIFWLTGYLDGQMDSQMKIEIENKLKQVNLNQKFHKGSYSAYNDTMDWLNKNSDVYYDLNNKLG